MAENKFKLPNSSYEEVVKIIKSYGQFSKPAGLDEVSKLIGMDKTVISRNVGFLVELGILEPGQKKAVTSLGKTLSQALEHEMPDEIRSSWRKIVHENEFSNKLVSAIKIRNGMDESTLQSHIAYSAGQPKKSQYMTGAKTLIDILRASELIKESDGKYVAAQSASAIEETVPQAESIEPEMVTAKKNFPVNTVVKSDTNAEIKICINVSVECEVNELDILGEKVRHILKEIDRTESASENTSEE